MTVRRDGTKLYAPGVGDDTRSLAVLLAWLRAMDAAAVRTRADLLFVADVGEEGPGDLRGTGALPQHDAPALQQSLEVVARATAVAAAA